VRLLTLIKLFLLIPSMLKLTLREGVVKYSLESSKAAIIADLNQAISINPKYVQAYYMRGMFKLISQSLDPDSDPNGAIADSKQAISINPKYAPAYYLLGAAKHVLGGDEPAAKFEARKAIELCKQLKNTLSFKEGYGASDSDEVNLWCSQMGFR
jgi:tetratricopeptide (TPR) repeat protein